MNTLIFEYPTPQQPAGPPPNNDQDVHLVTPLMMQTPTVPTIGIQNSSSILNDQDVFPVVKALQIQLDRDWQPAWNTNAKLIYYTKTQTIPESIWRITIHDTSDVTGALGYHDESNISVPYGKIFVQDAMMHGLNWTVTLSHELLEMMSNPWINLTVFRQTNNLGGRLYAYESCDAVQNDKYGYLINQILVSDFQYPAWFDDSPAPGAKFDHQGHCKNSFEILEGGYMPVFDVITGSGWKSLYHNNQIDFPQQSHTRNRYRTKNSPKLGNLHGCPTGSVSH